MEKLQVNLNILPNDIIHSTFKLIKSVVFNNKLPNNESLIVFDYYKFVK